MKDYTPDSYDVRMIITNFRKLMGFVTSSAGVVKWTFTPNEIEMNINDVGRRGRLDLFWNTSSLDYECNNPIEAMAGVRRSSASIAKIKEFIKGLPRNSRIFFTHGGAQVSIVPDGGVIKFVLVNPKVSKFLSTSSTFSPGRPVKELREEWSDREIMTLKFRFSDFIEGIRKVKRTARLVHLSYEDEQLFMRTKTKITKTQIPITPKKVFKSTGVFEGWYDITFLWEFLKSLRPLRTRNSGFFTMRVYEKRTAKSPNFLILEALDKKSNIRKEAVVTGVIALPRHLRTYNTSTFSTFLANGTAV